MKTVVLGGTGFLGSHLLAALCADGHEITTTFHTTEPDDGLRSLPVTWEQTNLDNSAAITRLCADADIVYHMASPTNPRSAAQDPRHDAIVNLSSVFAVIDALTEGGGTLVYLSSGGTVYGPAAGLDRIGENEPLVPISSYGVTKMAVEHHLRVAHRQQDLSYRVARISNPYGPFQRLESGQGAVGAFLDRALRGEAIELWGDGSVVRDYLYVSEVADALTRLGAYRGDCRVFNIGSGTGTSLLELIAAIEQVVGTKVVVNFLGARDFDVARNVLNIDLARSELGWSPQISLTDGITRYSDWMETRQL